MQRLAYGKISKLSLTPLPEHIFLCAPAGVRRNAWLAGRVLLLGMLDTDLPADLSEYYGEHGKPYFNDPSLPFFNLSHSGDYIACFISDEGEVGCDIEQIRPRTNWQKIAQEYFPAAEYEALLSLSTDKQLHDFWRLWTLKEAYIKRSAKSIWDIKTLAIPINTDNFTKSFFVEQAILSVSHETPISAEPFSVG